MDYNRNFNEEKNRYKDGDLGGLQWLMLATMFMCALIIMAENIRF